MKPITFFLLIFSLASLCTYAQNRTISGYVTDAATGERLIGAVVMSRTDQTGAVTNAYGYFSLSLPADSQALVVSFVGYRPAERKVGPGKDLFLEFALHSDNMLETVDVKGDRLGNVAETTRMSLDKLEVKTLKNLPVLLGEVDVLKTMQLLPGVQSGTEGSTGIYVRGGGPDQNLILLDGVPVYNVNHLFGFFSVFNADAIKSIQLTKGGYPARYGGRLSSVLDIRMKEGNMKEFHGQGSVGLISSKLSLEGPIVKDKTSFIVSARRTYLDLLARPIIRLVANANGEDAVGGYYFYDLNAKINHKFSRKHRLYLSAYTGRDKAFFEIEDEYSNSWYKDELDLFWGNFTSALRWNYLITPKLFTNLTVTFSDYTFQNDILSESKDYDLNSENRYGFNYTSGIRDYAGRYDMEWKPGQNHYFRAGVQLTSHEYNPGVNAFNFKNSDGGVTTKIDTSFGNKAIFSTETDAWIEDDWRILPRLKANVGVHFTHFNVQGKNYFSFQPRMALRYKLTPGFSLKASYSEMTQYILLLANTTMGLPTDLWLPVTRDIKPQQSRQVAGGLAWQINDNWQFSAEGYYKDMENLIEYKEGASFLSVSENWQDKILQGDGWSYGAEVLLKKNAGKFTGWLGYTLSWSWRQFDGISFGEKFPYRYDRRHDIGLALTYQINPNTNIGMSWIYGTGNAISLAYDKYISTAYTPGWSGSPYMIENYDMRNNYRMEAYHRMDISLNRDKEKKWGKRTWSVGLYNAYNHKNPFFMRFGTDWNGNPHLYKYSLFPIIPAISYRFEF